jgi:hypothetical protein
MARKALARRGSAGVERDEPLPDVVFAAVLLWMLVGCWALSDGIATMTACLWHPVLARRGRRCSRRRACAAYREGRYREALQDGHRGRSGCAGTRRDAELLYDQALPLSARRAGSRGVGRRRRLRGRAGGRSSWTLRGLRAGSAAFAAPMKAELEASPHRPGGGAVRFNRRSQQAGGELAARIRVAARRDEKSPTARLAATWSARCSRWRS